jgi:hypothetical protein
MDRRLEELLGKLPYAWSEADLSDARSFFTRARPSPAAALTRNLLRYWGQHSPDRSLFEDPDEDLALVLHGLALGLLDAAELPDYAERALDENAPRYAPLLPKAVPWGPRAALSPSVRAALPSSLVHAWVISDDQGPVEVLAVGQGLPEIQRRIEEAAFTASLRINGTADPAAGDPVKDVIAVGLIRVGVHSYQRHLAARLPGFGRSNAATNMDLLSTALGALRDFVALLRSLERQTKLVRIAEVSRRDSDLLEQALRSMAADAADEALLRPTSAGGTQRHGTSSDAAVLLPSLGIPSGEVIGLRLTPDLVRTRRYRELETAHQRAVADRLTMDARLRRDHNQEECDRLQAEHDAFKEATPQERVTFWDRNVLLNQKFDNRLGITVWLAQPEERPAEEYYLHRLPGPNGLIEQHRAWAERMALVVDNLEQAMNRPFAPARQLGLARFLDAALRDVVPRESPATTEAFRLWSRDVQPMLWFEWRRLHERRGLAVADVFTRHTILLTRYVAVPDEDETLVTQPHSMVDGAFSAVLADRRRGVLVVRDATDRAQPDQAVRQRPSATREGGDEAWSALCVLAERKDVTQEQFADAILEALRNHPETVIRKIAQTLQPLSPDITEAEVIDGAFGRARQKTAVSSMLERALWATRCGAFLTARECLRHVTSPASAEAPVQNNFAARAWLLRAIVECAAAGWNDRDIMTMLADKSPAMPPAALRALDEANQLDGAFADEWQAGCANDDLGRALRRLFQGLPRAQQVSSRREYAVLLFRQAIECARLARRLDECAGSIPDGREARDSVLAWTGQTLEELLTGPLAGRLGADVLAIMEVLTGREAPRYGRVVSP